MIGKTISHYKILEKLGEGGMGVVYKAEDTKLKRTVALKFLPPELTRSGEWQQRFLREAQAAAALAHPSICHTYEIDEADDQTFIAMEYVDGQSLTERIKSGPLDIDDTINVALRVAEGLKHAHKRGIVHRDIKPANIMITEDGQAKIMDFGLAKLAGKTRLTKTATVMGTVAYMSPEQAHGDSTIDHRTDIWSLGVVLYEMLAGVLPFDAETDTGLVYKIIHEDPAPIRSLRSDIPGLLASIVERAMQKNSQNRYEHMEEFIAGLESMKSGSMISMVRYSPSIAVLPFVNISADPDQEYFCDGLAEELINALTKLRDVRVVARTSAFSFKGKDVKVGDIGRELKVETVLEGSVRKAGNRLRITAQLIDVSGGHHLWSERYDREMDDIFAIQDDITLAIVSNLKPKLLGKQEARLARRQTVNLEAYNLYLRGQWHSNRLSEDGLRKGFEYFMQAIEKDRNCALAHAGLATIYNVLPIIAYAPPTETTPKAREAALKALEIDDTLYEAHIALAYIKDHYDWDWNGAENEFKRAMELNPGETKGSVYALHLMHTARLEEAVENMKRRLELDPLSPALSWLAGVIFFYAKQYDQAIEKFRNSIEMIPDRPQVHGWLGRAYTGKAMYEQALTEFAKEKEITGGANPCIQAFGGETYVKMGKRERVQELLDELLERAKLKYVAPTTLACLYFLLEENDQGFAWLDRAYEARDFWLSYLNIEPMYRTDPLDPRFKVFLKKIGLDK